MKLLIVFITSVLCITSCCSQKTALAQIEVNEGVAAQATFWVAGIKGGGSGVNLFINRNNIAIKPIKVYFSGLITEEIEESDTNYIVRFIRPANQLKNDLIGADEIKNTNSTAKAKRPFPFPELKKDEAIIELSVKKGSQQYIKIQGIQIKESLPYPSVKPQNK